MVAPEVKSPPRPGCTGRRVDSCQPGHPFPCRLFPCRLGRSATRDLRRGQDNGPDIGLHHPRRGGSAGICARPCRTANISSHSHPVADRWILRLGSDQRRQVVARILPISPALVESIAAAASNRPFWCDRMSREDPGATRRPMGIGDLRRRARSASRSRPSSGRLRMTNSCWHKARRTPSGGTFPLSNGRCSPRALPPTASTAR